MPRGASRILLAEIREPDRYHAVLEARPWWRRGVEIDTVVATRRVYSLEAKWSWLGGPSEDGGAVGG